MATKAPSGPRSIALVGPFSSGKTTLLENLLFAADAIPRKGSVKEGNMVGDASAEARARQMSVEVSAVTFEHMDEMFTVLDCPGSLEFIQEAMDAVVGVDAAVVVVEPDIDRVIALAPIFKFLERHSVPMMLFVNKMDRAEVGVPELLAALQEQSERPLVLRQVPIRDGESITGYIDLVHERAYQYKPGEASALIQIPEAMTDDEQQARTEMLESLADFDDALLEQLLEDVIPPNDEIHAALHKDFNEGLLVPALLGAAEQENGVRRLLKALRHDVPEAAETAERVGLGDGDEAAVQILKTYNLPSSGKVSLARVWRGSIGDGASLGGQRIGSINTMSGQALTKISKAEAGQIVALGRMDGVKTGQLFSTDEEMDA
ncbi:MAG: GTP-binding protein, partial [Alphaproteobacteria bacterium]|nr:GTP-binding protein [Alphaproteobacteria bacterium]